MTSFHYHADNNDLMNYIYNDKAFITQKYDYSCFITYLYAAYGAYKGIIKPIKPYAFSKFATDSETQISSPVLHTIDSLQKKEKSGIVLVQMPQPMGG